MMRRHEPAWRNPDASVACERYTYVGPWMSYVNERGYVRMLPVGDNVSTSLATATVRTLVYIIEFAVMEIVAPHSLQTWRARKMKDFDAKVTV